MIDTLFNLDNSPPLTLDRIRDLKQWATGGINNPTVNSKLYEDLYIALGELERFCRSSIDNAQLTL